MPAICREGKIPSSVCNIERTTYKFAAFNGMLPPRRQGAKGDICPRLIASQVSLFDKVVAKLAEPKSILVIVESWPSKHPEPDIAEARCVAVAVFEAEAHHPANHQC